MFFPYFYYNGVPAAPVAEYPSALAAVDRFLFTPLIDQQETLR